MEQTRCMFCNGIWYEGKMDGILIFGNYICPDCEQSIVETGYNKADNQYYINGLKKIWRCLKA